MNDTESRLLYLKTRKDIIYIVVGALIPAYPFYAFMSFYQSLGEPFACIYLGWWSDCGLFAALWLVAESVGDVLIIKGLLLYGKSKHAQKSEKPRFKKRSTRSNPLM